MREWETRDSRGRYFEDAENTRREIGALEASVEHVASRLEVRGEQPNLMSMLRDTGVIKSDQSAVAPVQPATGTDRGTTYDRPARELERIARERERLLGYYRNVDRKFDEAERLIADIERRAGG